MIITGEKLRLYYHGYYKSNGYLINLKEIENEQYGYNLIPGQKLFAIRYEKTNLECYFRCKVLNINDEGLLISTAYPETNVFLPWEKDFPVPAYSKTLTKCNLYIEPCECLFEKNKLVDILKGNIDKEDYNSNKYSVNLGRGIWYKHGGWRTISEYEENLNHFVKLGQLALV